MSHAMGAFLFHESFPGYYSVDSLLRKVATLQVKLSSGNLFSGISSGRLPVLATTCRGLTWDSLSEELEDDFFKSLDEINLKRKYFRSSNSQGERQNQTLRRIWFLENFGLDLNSESPFEFCCEFFGRQIVRDCPTEVMRSDPVVPDRGSSLQNLPVESEYETFYMNHRRSLGDFESESHRDSVKVFILKTS